jgi:hypothetical protein
MDQCQFGRDSGRTIDSMDSAVGSARESKETIQAMLAIGKTVDIMGMVGSI